jgi:hypothetical protein
MEGEKAEYVQFNAFVKTEKKKFMQMYDNDADDERPKAATGCEGRWLSQWWPQ